MRILSNHGWGDTVLDAHLPPGAVRISVSGIVNIAKLDGVYFVRRKTWRLVWNYIREIGVANVLRKVCSRKREALRNEKYLSVGVGEVLQGESAAPGGRGSFVVFVAPCHPACAERVVLPLALTSPIEGLPPVLTQQSEVKHISSARVPSSLEKAVAKVKAWSLHSGIELRNTAAILAAASDFVAELDWERAAALQAVPRSPVSERRKAAKQGRSGVPTATLMGYGNYAKTVILPNVEPKLAVARIHEIDPAQIPPRNATVAWDTSPLPRSDDTSDVLLIAGYHHTHAPLAIEALQNGKWAVAEKPLAVDRAQLDELVEAVERARRYFGCFHKRYLPFNKIAQTDLKTRSGHAISYHCIVYEVPLPPMHWYNWPVSKSRLVSNGCHWLDHFLFLNAFAAPVARNVVVAADGTINCTVELDNGAVFSMLLTDNGSERIGVQDYIELRANGVTVKMENGAKYTAEGPEQIIRRARINKMRSYGSMYRTIADRIARGQPGDSPRSVRLSGELVLDLEDMLVTEGQHGAVHDAQR
jgi:predicted dehydrogenase